MSAQIETIFDQLSSPDIHKNSIHKNSGVRGSHGPSDGTIFADLLRDRAANSIALLNSDSQFNMPEGAELEEFDFATSDTGPIDNDAIVEDEHSVDNGQYAKDNQNDAANQENQAGLKQADPKQVPASNKQAVVEDTTPSITGANMGAPAGGEANATVIDPNTAIKTDGAQIHTPLVQTTSGQPVQLQTAQLQTTPGTAQVAQTVSDNAGGNNAGVDNFGAHDAMGNPLNLQGQVNSDQGENQADPKQVPASNKQAVVEDTTPSITGANMGAPAGGEANATVIDPNTAIKTDGAQIHTPLVQTTSGQPVQLQTAQLQTTPGTAQVAQTVSDNAGGNNAGADNFGAQNAPKIGPQQVNKIAGTATDKTTSKTNAIQIEANTNETVDIDPAQLKPQQAAKNVSGKNASGLNVSVTDKQSMITGQQNSSLAAASTVVAQTTKTAPTGESANPRTTVADMLLETAEEAALTGNQISGKANTARSDAQSNNNGANNSNGNQAGQNLSDHQAALKAAQATPATTAQLSPTVTPVTNTGSATPITANGAAGSLGQIAGLDSVTGAAVLDGQNGQTVKPSASSQAIANNRPNIPAKLVSDQVSVNIQRAAGKGQDQIRIQLRPHELGRIEVTMEMAKDGKMAAVITAEKQETLDMLKNDSNNLVKSLNEAGMRTDSSSLNFNLGNQGRGYGQFADSNGVDKDPETNFAQDSEDAAEEVAEASAMLGLGEEARPDADGRYDIQV